MSALLYTEVDGNFPNHHPDPTVEANLEDLRALVAEKRLDFGIAFDCPGDRIGAIDGEGRVIWGDQLLMIYAEDALSRHKGVTVIANVKASRALFERIAQYGGVPLMWKTGHSLIKSKMKEFGSPLAGEMSGHVFFADDYYGYDDALYAGVRLIAASARLGRSMTQLRGAMPAMINTPEMRFQVDESRKFAAIDGVQGAAREQPSRGRFHRWRAGDQRRRLVAAARLEPAGRSCGARGKRRPGGPRPPARADRRAIGALGARARGERGALRAASIKGL